MRRYGCVGAFEQYSDRSLTHFVKEAEYWTNGENHRYKHFELIDRLINEFPDIVQQELARLSLLDEDEVNRIVVEVPDALLTDEHKVYIIRYILCESRVG